MLNFLTRSAAGPSLAGLAALVVALSAAGAADGPVPAPPPPPCACQGGRSTSDGALVGARTTARMKQRAAQAAAAADQSPEPALSPVQRQWKALEAPGAGGGAGTGPAAAAPAQQRLWKALDAPDAGDEAVRSTASPTARRLWAELERQEPATVPGTVAVQSKFPSGAAGGPSRSNPAQPNGADSRAVPRAAAAEATVRIARSRAQAKFRGTPDPAAFAVELQNQLYVAQSQRAGLPVRRELLLPQPGPNSVATTETFQRNLPELINERLGQFSNLGRPVVGGRPVTGLEPVSLSAPAEMRIVIGGGIPVTPRVVGGVRTETFPDNVALLAGRRAGCCSGTLIGKNVVLTAAHCLFSECGKPKEVFVGNDLASGVGAYLAVRAVVPHPEYDPRTNRNDIAVLILDREIETVPLAEFGGLDRPTPRPMATREEINGANAVYLVGFGATDLQPRGFGIKNLVAVPISSYSCERVGDSDKFDCHPRTELVAGGLGSDTCNGDSGGPAYVKIGDAYKLAGVTSRATLDATRACGDGGIYTRVDEYQEWIIRAAVQAGGRFR